MPNKYPLFSIVILNWNGLEDTLLCLEYVKRLDYKNFEIILVDNGSSDQEKNKLKTVKGIKYIDLPKNLGFTGGHIEGLKKANGEFILLLNNDVVIQKDYLKNAVSIFNDDSVAVVGGRSYYWDDKNKINNESNEFYSYLDVDPYTGETPMKNSDSGANQIVNTVSGSAVVVRRSVVDRVGYIDNQFFAYYEETDLFARLKRAGYKIIYSPNLRIWHRNGASSGLNEGSYFFFYQIFRNRFVFAIRNFEFSFLIKFLFNYHKSGLKYIIKWREGIVQKRIAKAYLMAILTNYCHIFRLIKERRKIISSNPGYTYCKNVLIEQRLLNNNEA